MRSEIRYHFFMTRLRPKIKKISITRLILEKLGELGEGTLDGFLPPQYPEAALVRIVLGLDSKRKISRRTFSALLSRLTSQGLVERSGTHRSGQWSITPQGKARLVQQDAISRIVLPQEDGIGRLVIFDIPEQERKKRDSIRAELISACFTQLQKSVWIGYRPLPKDFLIFLDDLNVREHVHIFSVKSEGTLED